MGDFLVEYLATRFPGIFALLLLSAAGGFVYLLQLPENTNAGSALVVFIWMLIAAFVAGSAAFGWVAVRRRRGERGLIVSER